MGEIPAALYDNDNLLAGYSSHLLKGDAVKGQVIPQIDVKFLIEEDKRGLVKLLLPYYH
jgi:hypothetical protein